MSRFAKMLFVLTLLCALLVPASAVMADANPPIVRVFPPVVDNLTIGQTFTMDVQVDTALQARGMQFQLAFNPSVLEIVGGNAGVDEGTFFSNYAATIGGSTLVFPAPVVNNPAGTVASTGIAIMGGTATGAIGVGQAFTVEFRAKANGSADVTLSGVTVSSPSGAAIPGVTSQNGVAWVGQAAPMPDLAVTVLSASPVPGTQDYNVSFTVKNQGTLDAPVASTAALKIDGAQVGTFPVAALAAGAEVVINAGPYTTSGSNDSVEAVADSLLEIAEANEVNNIKSMTYSPVSDNGDTIIDAGFGAFLDITPPADVLNWALVLGDNSKSGVLNVKCNTSWQVDVSDDVPTSWNLTDWNGATYGATKLAQDLHAKCVAEGTDVSAGTAKIADGIVGGQAGVSGQDFGVDFTQVLEYADPLLASGHSYHLVLTFTGYVTL